MIMRYCNVQTNKHNMQATMNPTICIHRIRHINNRNQVPVFPGYIYVTNGRICWYNHQCYILFTISNNVSRKEQDPLATMNPIICTRHRLHIKNGNKDPMCSGCICNRWQNMLEQPSMIHCVCHFESCCQVAKCNSNAMDRADLKTCLN